MRDNCEDCGLPITDSHVAFAEQWEPGRAYVCYPHVNFGGEQLCAERTVERLRAQLSAATARAEAAEAKVRDVETLDEWCGAVSNRLAGLYSFHSAFEVELEEDCATLHYNAGATPAEARASAAQWVRENSPPQKKPTDDGGRGEGSDV